MTVEFLADQLGSLIRPPHLLQAAAEFAAGTRDRVSLTQLEDEAILESLEKQRATGIDVLVDGEFRRTGFMTGFPSNVEGFTVAPASAVEWRGGDGHDEASPNTQLVITSKLKVVRRIAQEEAAFLQQHAPGKYKITLPSPVNFAFLMWRRGLSDDAYATPSEFLADAAEILAVEVRQLVAEGTPYIQLDAPTYTHWLDDSLRPKYEAAGFDLDVFLTDAIAAENTILDAAGDDIVTAVHLCRGNSLGRWLAEGGYDALAERLFNDLRCERLMLEYDDSRSGGFEPLRFVPDDKIVVLGLITTKRGEMETRDELLRRIEDATRFVPLERLTLSPQCGFASSGKSNPITEDEQWRKLELVVSVAEDVWGSARV
jgi:5-methyltetrahydropteroyltriglutamate--homocysteine methyltransferase